MHYTAVAFFFTLYVFIVDPISAHTKMKKVKTRAFRTTKTVSLPASRDIETVLQNMSDSDIFSLVAEDARVIGKNIKIKIIVSYTADKRTRSHSNVTLPVPGYSLKRLPDSRNGLKSEKAAPVLTNSYRAKLARDLGQNEEDRRLLPQFIFRHPPRVDVCVESTLSNGSVVHRYHESVAVAMGMDVVNLLTQAKYRFSATRSTYDLPNPFVYRVMWSPDRACYMFRSMPNVPGTSNATWRVKAINHTWHEIDYDDECIPTVSRLNILLLEKVVVYSVV